MRPREDLHVLGDRGVPGDRTVVGTVEPHQLGQHVRVPGVALGAGDAVAFPVPGGLQRVDRVDAVAGREQRLDPGATVGLDPDQNLIRLVIGQMISHQGVHRGDPGHPLGQPPPHETLTVLIDDLDIVMIFGPVVTDEQHRCSCSSRFGQHQHEPRCELRGDRDDLMDQCSPVTSGTTSHQPCRPLTHRPGHDLDLGLSPIGAWRVQCSPDGGSGTSLDHQPEHRCSPIRPRRPCARATTTPRSSTSCSPA
jgi:hypothetical protein